MRTCLLSYTMLPNLIAAFDAAMEQRDFALASTLIMIHNLHAYRADQAKTKAIKESDYEKTLTPEKVHGDHVVNNVCPQLGKIERALGLVLFPEEIKILFSSLRAFAARAPQGGDDMNSMVFPLAAAQLLGALTAAKDILATSPAKARALVDAALEIFLECSYDGAAEHRIENMSNMLVTHDKADQRSLQRAFGLAKQKWRALLSLRGLLVDFIIRQLARSEPTWSGRALA